MSTLKPDIWVDGWPRSRQFEIVEPTEERLEGWHNAAQWMAPRIKLGEWNWPMMIRSLVAEVRTLRSRVAQLEANAAEDYERRSAEEPPHGP